MKYQCLLYHHLKKFGSSNLKQQSGHFALLGFGKSTQPLIVNTTVLFNIEDKSIPSIDYLKDLDATNKINTNPPTTGK
eukprot:6312933-Ditylum_brightwellii.AAC.1